ncbi:lipoyltransferase 1, mitochondrial isoform X2 [Orussus abietinus]|uniref:lipoyltransferase 1, mitochondrial isoform X2 n=1 Tax=Orussus abietinus TaxID=222816 RepID=UPI00062628C7|nr:lipoyltransferase 1, mitochondrial isoform X2 [Orussus abietinus]
MFIISRNLAIVGCRSLYCEVSRVKRYASTKSSLPHVDEQSIKKSVFISQSTDIYTNLALEDWFYKNYDFTNHHILLLWRNDPCVVIGRHQNPWIESNAENIDANGITLARRNSGGGTVYHDSGNLNLSFFTPRERYNRKYNLNIVTRALYREWGLKSTVNNRDDIVVQGDFKVSGTAAKLGRPNAYHHCTVLVGVNKSILNFALERKEIRSDVLLNAIGWEYLRTKALTLEDGGHGLVQQQKGFQMINPTEDWFPGINQLANVFRSWNWTYGKTPKFTVTYILDLPMQNGEVHHANLNLEVQNGIIEEIRITLPEGVVPANFNKDASVITNLKGTKYTPAATRDILAALGCKSVPLNTTQKLGKSNVAATQ